MRTVLPMKTSTRSVPAGKRQRTSSVRISIRSDENPAAVARPMNRSGFVFAILPAGIGTSLRSARLTGPALSAAVRAADKLRPGAAAVADETSREDGCGTAVATVEQVAT